MVTTVILHEQNNPNLFNHKIWQIFIIHSFRRCLRLDRTNISHKIVSNFQIEINLQTFILLKLANNKQISPFLLNSHFSMYVEFPSKKKVKCNQNGRQSRNYTLKFIVLSPLSHLFCFNHTFLSKLTHKQAAFYCSWFHFIHLMQFHTKTW